MMYFPVARRDRRAVAAFESLEGRTLMAAASGVTYDPQVVPIHGGGCSCWACGGSARQTPAIEAPATLDPAVGQVEPAAVRSFKQRINFQPADKATVPRSHRADVGRPFATRGNGLQYGWDRSIESGGVDRDSDRSPDDRYDTFLQVPVGASWEIAVPNGRYYVSLVAGDPTSLAGQFVVDAEGRPFLFGSPREGFEWVEGAGYVDVSDGRLTLTAAAGSDGLKLDFVQVIQAAPAPAAATAAGQDLDWENTTVGVSPIGRIEPGVARLNGKVYVMGGYTTANGTSYGDVTSRVDVFDTTTEAWTRGADLPLAQTHFGAATDGRLIFTAGGQVGTQDVASGTNQVFRYYPKAEKWVPYVNLPEVRFAGALAYHDDYLYFFGGDAADRVIPQSDAWRLNTRAKQPTWEPIADLTRAADHLGVEVLDGQIYLIGGEHGHGLSYVQHDDVFRYDPSADAYERLAGLPDGGSSHFEGNVIENGGQIWVLGGRGNGNSRIADVRSYDPSRDVWEVHTPMPIGRFGGASWIVDGAIYFSAGDVEGRGGPRETIRATIG